MRLRGVFVAIALTLLPMSAVAQWPFGLSGDAPSDAPTTSSVRVFKIGGEVSETASPWSTFGFNSALVFPQLIARIRSEARDPAVKALVFRFARANFGLAQLESLRRAMQQARSRGKRVFTHFEVGMNATLLASTAADEVHMTPEGTVFLTGLRAEVAFYKELLESLGLEVDIEAQGMYKSAAEPMTRTTMSDEARVALDAVLDSVFDTLVDGLAANRKLSRKAARALLDTGMVGADEAKRLGVVDTLSYWPQLVEQLSTNYGERPTLAWPVVEAAPEIGSLFGLLEFLGKADKAPATGRPRIATLVVEGPIVSGRQPQDLFDDTSVIASEDFLTALREINEDKLVKALVVRIDSPGGSALASDIIWRALTEADKVRPVVVSMGNVAASGGYYIASAARKIIAEAGTLTGSIGVFGGKMIVKELLDKIGVNTVVLSRGKHAGLFSSMNRFSDSERAVFRANMKSTYDTFVNRVARGRSMSYDAVHRVAQGRVWTGRQAMQVGLVDTLGGIDEAIAEAARLAGVTLDDADVVSYPEAKSILEMLQDEPTTLRAPRLDLSALATRLPAPAARRAMPLARTLDVLLSGELSLTMMPMTITIR